MILSSQVIRVIKSILETMRVLNVSMEIGQDLSVDNIKHWVKSESFIYKVSMAPTPKINHEERGIVHNVQDGCGYKGIANM